jgi:hypothetical protein
MVPTSPARGAFVTVRGKPVQLYRGCARRWGHEMSNPPRGKACSDGYQHVSAGRPTRHDGPLAQSAGSAEVENDRGTWGEVFDGDSDEVHSERAPGGLYHDPPVR